MDLALNNLQRLICHKPKQTNQPLVKTSFVKLLSIKIYLLLGLNILINSHHKALGGGHRGVMVKKTDCRIVKSTSTVLQGEWH